MNNKLTPKQIKILQGLIKDKVNSLRYEQSVSEHIEDRPDINLRNEINTLSTIYQDLNSIYPTWQEVSEAIEKADSEHCAALDKNVADKEAK